MIGHAHAFVSVSVVIPTDEQSAAAVVVRRWSCLADTLQTTGVFERKLTVLKEVVSFLDGHVLYMGIQQPVSIVGADMLLACPIKYNLSSGVWNSIDDLSSTCVVSVISMSPYLSPLDVGGSLLDVGGSLQQPFAMLARYDTVAEVLLSAAQAWAVRSTAW